ncbi:MAG: hypothetical protein IPM34_05840 [Saprospiraceae bacterium]|nr:hypothetical protein [Saprospiraceae bacterium]
MIPQRIIIIGIHLCILVQFQSGISQEITSFRKGNLFQKSASFSITYNGNIQSRDTLGDLNSSGLVATLRGSLSLFQIQVPVHFTYRTGQFSSGFTNPFVRFGISPSYKWIKLHLGHRLMHFSNYSLNGITFLGAGIELNPGLFRFASFAGEIQTPNYNLDSLAYYSHLIQQFSRNAHGFKIGVGKDRTYFDIHYLKVKDEFNLPSDSTIYKTIFPPSENLVLGVKGSLQLLKKISLEVHADLSALTNNQLAREDSVQDQRSRDIQDFVDPFITTNNTTRAHLAYEANLQYNHSAFNFGIHHKHIDPNYKSLGMHYILDDLESYTLQAGIRLNKNKINISGNYGLQKNNLNNIHRNTSKRNIYSVNAMLLFGKTAGLQGSYSNFSMDQTPGFALIQDSFRLIQTTSVLAANPFYKLNSDRISQQWTFSFQNNSIKDASPIENPSRDGKSLTYSLNYNINFKLKKISTGISLLNSHQEFSGKKQKRLGGNLSFRKNFDKPQISIQTHGAYFIIQNDNDAKGHSINAGLQSQYQISKPVQLGIQLGLLDRSSGISGNYKEWRFSIHFTYSFFQNTKDGNIKN